jgi:glycosyltransferase involved in cell wall biosynthesis
VNAAAPTYAVVTPTRDELPNLERLAACMTAQTRLPEAWVIVDNGSTDGTAAYVEMLAREHEWVVASASEPSRTAEPGAPIVRAFEAGVQHLERRTDVLVKLDADVSFEDDHFERLLAGFVGDPRLGIAGSACFEESDGRWIEATSTSGHVRGAVRAYRWACYDDVSPLEPGLGWDTVDELKASLAGWTTGIVAGVGFRHHRKVGARDGSRWRRARRQGQASHYLGYKPWYLVLRSCRRAFANPAALGMIWGYIEAVAGREPRIADEAVIREARRGQSVGQLPMRLAETRLGRRLGSSRSVRDSSSAPRR